MTDIWTSAKQEKCSAGSLWGFVNAADESDDSESATASWIKWKRSPSSAKRNQRCVKTWSSSWCLVFKSSCNSSHNKVSTEQNSLCVQTRSTYINCVMCLDPFTLSVIYDRRRVISGDDTTSEEVELTAGVGLSLKACSVEACWQWACRLGGVCMSLV